MLKRTCKLLALIGALISVTACGFFAKPEPTPTPAPPVTLKYVSFNALAGIEEPLLKQFETDHPNIQIEQQGFRLNSRQYLSDTPPDIMTAAPGALLDQAISDGLVTDITDIWQQADFANNYPTNLRALSEKDGKQYMLPIGYNWNAIYYNKQIFAQYNLQPPKTWDEFTQLCDTLLVNGITPLSLSGRNAFMASLWIDYLDLRLNGADFHRQLMAGEIPYNDSRVQAVFERWREMVTKGYFLADSQSLQNLNSLTAIIRGDNGKLGNQKAAMVLTGPFFLTDLPEPFRKELDFFPFPTLDPGIPTSEVVFAIGYVIPAKAEHRQEALNFLTYLGSEKAQALLSQNATSGVYAPAHVGDSKTLPAITQQGMQLVADAKTVGTPYFIAVNQKVQFEVGNALRQLLLDSRSSETFDLNKMLGRLEQARQAK